MNGMIRHMKALHICLTAFAVICLTVLIGMGAPAAAAEDQDGGVYDGVPWRITADGTLLIGEEGKEYTFDNKETREREDWPWNYDSFGFIDIDDCWCPSINRAYVLGKVHGNGSCAHMFDTGVWYAYSYESGGGTYDNWIQRIDVRNLITGDVTDMSYMFNHCKASFLDLSGFNTSNVTDMNKMFYDCTAKGLNLRSFDTSKVTDMRGMFEGCKTSSLDLSSFNTNNVTDMSEMFSGCGASSLDLSGFDTRNVAYMTSMFEDCKANSLDLTNFDTRNAIEMSAMFSGCKSLEQIVFGKWKYDKCDEKFSKPVFPIAMYDVSNKCKQYSKGKTIPENTNHTFVAAKLLQPAKVKLTGLKAGKKAMTVKWKKGKKPVAGYQIMYSTSSKFKKGKKTVKVKGLSKTSKKIQKLKSKKTYYVRVRAYRTYHKGTVYSNWSNVKRVRIK